MSHNRWSLKAEYFILQISWYWKDSYWAIQKSLSPKFPKRVSIVGPWTITLLRAESIQFADSWEHQICWKLRASNLLKAESTNVVESWEHQICWQLRTSNLLKAESINVAENESIEFAQSINVTESIEHQICWKLRASTLLKAENINVVERWEHQISY